MRSNPVVFVRCTSGRIRVPGQDHAAFLRQDAILHGEGALWRELRTVPAQGRIDLTSSS